MTPAPTIDALRKRNDPKLAVLPTAAPRKVKQSYNAGWREEHRKLIEAAPWPGKYIPPWERERQAKQAAAPSLSHIERTPALIIAICLYAMAPKQHRAGAYAAAKMLAAFRKGSAFHDAMLMMDSVANLQDDAVTLAAVGTGGEQ